MASLDISNVEGGDVEMNIEDSYLTDEVGDMVNFEEDFHDNRDEDDPFNEDGYLIDD